MSQSEQSSELITEPNIGSRILAGFIDYLIIYGFFFIYTYVFGEPNDDGQYTVTGLLAVVPVIFWGIMTVGLEMGLGATLGNMLAGLKAIPKSGKNRKLSFSESFKRHLLDHIDMFLFGIIGITAIKNTDKNQRLGDLWGNTIVVRAERLTKKKHSVTSHES